MGNINLSTTETRSSEPVPHKTGIIIIILVMVIVALSYAGLYYYESGLDGKIEALQAEYGGEKAKLNTDKNKNIVAVQNRLNAAGGLVDEKNIPLESLYELEKKMVLGNYIVSYSYDQSKRELDLACVAGNFNLMATQILNFKNSSFFREVHIGRSSLNEDKKVDYSIILNLN